MINHDIVVQTVNDIIVIATNNTPYVVGSTHDLGFVWPVCDLNWRENSGLKFNSVSEKLYIVAGKSVMLQFQGPPAPLNVTGWYKGESEKSNDKESWLVGPGQPLNGVQTFANSLSKPLRLFLNNQGNLTKCPLD